MANVNMKKMKKFMKGIGFHLVKEVGTGGFGTVYEAIKIRGTKKGKAFAVKKVQKSDEKSITREIIVQERLPSSTCIPKFHFKYSTQEDTYLFFDFIRGGNLLDLRRKNKPYMYEADLKPYLERIIKGIEELHAKRIIHRDIKLENIVLDEDGTPYIIDFGCSKIFDENDIEQTAGRDGTITYSSPEMLRDEDYSYDADWWAFGVCVFEMLVGDLPFEDNDESNEVIKERILTEEICWSRTDHLSEDARDFLKRLLCKDPQNRLGRNGAQEIWNHPFIAS